MIESLSEKIAKFIKRANEHETVSVEVMKYALIILFNIFIPILIVLGVSLFTGKIAQSLIAIISFVLLRMASGGYHFKSPIMCMLSTILATGIPANIPLPDSLTLPLTIVSLVLVIMLAPSNMRGYHSMPEKYFPLLKLLAAVMVITNFFIGSDIVAFVFTIQGLSLFHWKEV
jgi:accessory gene regulator B